MTSYGSTYSGEEVTLLGTNVSFGEFSVDTRGSSFAPWIDSTVGGTCDLVVDMNSQLVGNNSGIDSIELRRSGSVLDVFVNGQSYNRDSLNNIFVDYCPGQRRRG